MRPKSSFLPSFFLPLILCEKDTLANKQASQEQIDARETSSLTTSLMNALKDDASGQKMKEVRLVRENWILTKLITRNELLLWTKNEESCDNATRWREFLRNRRGEARFTGFETIRFDFWSGDFTRGGKATGIVVTWTMSCRYRLLKQFVDGGLLLWLAIALPTSMVTSVYHVVRHAKITTVLFMSVTYSWPGINIIFRLHQGLFGQLLTRSVISFNRGRNAGSELIENHRAPFKPSFATELPAQILFCYRSFQVSHFPTDFQVSSNRFSCLPRNLVV